MTEDSRAYHAVSRLTTGWPRVQRWVWAGVYRYLGRHFRSPEWTFMNWGYAALGSVDGGDGHTRELDPVDEADRYETQLYDRVASQADLSENTVVEVGCGRGGGAAWVARALGPDRVIGLDFSPSNIDFCRERHAEPNLEYRVGDAEALELADASVDVVLNVESSHCYASMPQFLSEVTRVVRPGGELLWADFRPPETLGEAPDWLTANGWEQLALDDITDHVVRALDLMVPRRRRLIREQAPRLLWGALEQFAAFPGSRHYEELRTRERTYLCGRFRRA